MSDPCIRCPQCRGRGAVTLSAHAPQTALVLTLLRDRGTIGTADVVRHLDTSQANAANLLRALVEWGFAAPAPKVGRERRWALLESSVSHEMMDAQAEIATLRAELAAVRRSRDTLYDVADRARRVLGEALGTETLPEDPL